MSRYFLVQEDDLGMYGDMHGSATVGEAKALLEACSPQDHIVLIKGEFVDFNFKEIEIVEVKTEVEVAE